MEKYKNRKTPHQIDLEFPIFVKKPLTKTFDRSWGYLQLGGGIHKSSRVFENPDKNRGGNLAPRPPIPPEAPKDGPRRFLAGLKANQVPSENPQWAYWRR